MSKTEKYSTPRDKKRVPHPKRYTDPAPKNIKDYIEEELDEDKFLMELLYAEKAKGDDED